MFEKIMVCVDGSKAAAAALRTTIEFAKRFDVDQVLAIHVVPHMTLYEGEGVWRANLMTHLDEHGREVLAEAEKELGRHGISPTAIKAYGDPGYQIVKRAKNEAVDLIIIGNRGLTGISSILLGSVGERVARNALGSVLIIRDGEEAKDDDSS